MQAGFLESHQSQVLVILQRYFPALQGVYVFGSTVSSETRSDSDLDLAILLPEPTNSTHLWECQQEIEAFLRQDVDLIDLQAASTVLRAQIINTGVCILVLDLNACQVFEMLSLSMYLRFNEERKPIIDAILHDKRILS